MEGWLWVVDGEVGGVFRSMENLQQKIPPQGTALSTHRSFSVQEAIAPGAPEGHLD